MTEFGETTRWSGGGTETVVRDAFLVFLLCVALNLFLVHPSLSPFRDAGDLAASVSTLGVAHPPGYPLYVLSGRLVQCLLPFGNPIYQLNLHSALFGAAGTLMLFLLLARLAGRFAAWTGAILAALFSPVLAQSGMSEVYALNWFWSAVLLWGAFRLRTVPDLAQRSRGWFLLAFWGGLGTGNHQSLILAGAALFLFLWRERRSGMLSSSFWVLAGGSFALGLSIYLFLPVRGAFADYVWGDPTSWNGFLRIFTRSDYGAASLSSRYSSAAFGEALKFWFQVWQVHWGTWGAGLGAAAGIWALGSRRRFSWGGPLWVFWIFTGPLFAFLARMEPGELSGAILLPTLLLPGAAAAVVSGLFLDGVRRWGRLGSVLAVATFLAVLGTKSLPGVLGQNQRWNLLAPDYGRNLLRTTPPDSPLLMISDTALFSVDALRWIWHQRSDVKVLVDADLPWRWDQQRRRYPELFEEGQPNGGPAFVRFQGSRRQIYTEGMQAALVDQLCPVGMSARVQWPRRDDSCLAQIEKSFWLWDMYVRRIPSSLILLNGYYNRQLLQTVSSGGFNTGLLLREAGREDSAQKAYAKALFWNPQRLMRWREAF